MSKVLCIDPSFNNTGYTVFSLNPDDSFSLVDNGIIKTEKSDKKLKIRSADDTVRRIQFIIRELLGLIKTHDVKALIAELPHGGAKSASAAKGMAIAQAICATLAEFTGLPAEWVTPTEVKVALTGNKVASKEDCMGAADELYPKLGMDYANTSGRGKSRYLLEFEHVADSVGALQASKDGQMIRMLKSLISMS